MSKGSNRRPEAKPGNFDRGHAAIRWASDKRKGKRKKGAKV